jgi:hypothetical protein
MVVVRVLHHLLIGMMWMAKLLVLYLWDFVSPLKPWRSSLRTGWHLLICRGVTSGNDRVRGWLLCSHWKKLWPVRFAFFSVTLSRTAKNTTLQVSSSEKLSLKNDDLYPFYISISKNSESTYSNSAPFFVDAMLFAFLFESMNVLFRDAAERPHWQHAKATAVFDD